MAQILVIDDDHDILNLVDKLLQKGGHTAFTADCAHKGLEILNSVDIDAVITDINMPGFSGFDLLAKMHQQGLAQDLPIAMLTGERERQSIEKAIELGADDYIVKPIDPMLFLKKVQNLLKKKAPSEGKKEAHFSYANAEGAAELNFSIKVLTLSEVGLKAQSNIEFSEGALVKINFDLFDILKIKEPHFKVLSCAKNNENNFTMILSFVGADENTRQKLRSWIYSQNLKRVA